MCLASTACPFAGFCCIVWSLTLCFTASEMAGTMKDMYRLPHHMSVLSNGGPRPGHFPDFPVSPGILYRHAPVSHGTFCIPGTLCSCTPFHPSMPCRSPSLRPVASTVHVHPCPCSSLHPQANFVSNDPHLTLRSPLEPWPALLSASSPQKGLWASEGTWYKPHGGFD